MLIASQRDLTCALRNSHIFPIELIVIPTPRNLYKDVVNDTGFDLSMKKREKTKGFAKIQFARLKKALCIRIVIKRDPPETLVFDKKEKSKKTYG